MQFVSSSIFYGFSPTYQIKYLFARWTTQEKTWGKLQFIYMWFDRNLSCLPMV